MNSTYSRRRYDTRDSAQCRASGAEVPGPWFPAFPRRFSRFAPYAPQSTPGGPVTTTEISADQARQALVALRTEIGKAVVGQDTAVTALVLALLCRGHVLLEGVPGTA